MSLYIQDPEDPNTTYLLEVLVAACAQSTGGGGAFAWATSLGTNLLLGDKSFVDLASKHDFDLVVGIDAITNEKALETLQQYSDQLAGLTVKIFMHNYAGTIFHPKFTWFRNTEGGIVISGSGNLTDGGLRGNWEAFTVSKMNDSAITTVETYWSDWRAQHADKLFSPSDSDVIERAKKNIGWGGGGKPGAKKKPKLKVVGTPAKTTKVAKKGVVVDEVLVAEIPKGSSRWNQANFDQKNYEDFFGAKIGTQRMMFFRHIAEDGSVEPTEVRPSVAVKSSNYRFELAAAAGLSYPTNGRPIGVFVRESVRTFRYQLLMPGDDGHSVMADFLDKNWSGPAGRMKRVRTTVSALVTLWPSSGLWGVDLLPSE